MNTLTTGAELLPCPHCGLRLERSGPLSSATASLWLHPRNDDAPCFAENQGIWDKDPDRIAAWNRRAPAVEATGAEPVAWVSGTALARLAESERGCETVNLWKSPPTTDAQPLYTAPAVEAGDRERVWSEAQMWAAGEAAFKAVRELDRAGEGRSSSFREYDPFTAGKAILAALQKGEGR